MNAFYIWCLLKHMTALWFKQSTYGDGSLKMNESPFAQLVLIWFLPSSRQPKNIPSSGDSIQSVCYSHLSFLTSFYYEAIYRLSDGSMDVVWNKRTTWQENLCILEHFYTFFPFALFEILHIHYKTGVSFKLKTIVTSTKNNIVDVIFVDIMKSGS